MMVQKKELIKNSLIFFIGYFFSYVLTNYFFANSPYMIISSCSILTVFLVVIIFYLLKLLYAENDRGKICSTIWASFIFALIINLSKQFAESHTFNFSFKSFVVFLVLWCLIESILIVLVNYFLKLNAGQFKLELIFVKRKYFFLVWIAMFLCWMPALLAMFPGNFAYDAWPQVEQMLVDHQLNAHHPVIHTVFLNACMVVGNGIFKSYNAGVLVYCVVQGVLLSGMLTLFIYKLYQWKSGTVLFVGTFLFFSFNPFIQCFAFTMTKDVLFSGMFLLVMVYSFEIIKDTDMYLSKRFGILKYAVCVILMCMLRNQGKYVFIVFIPFLVVSVKHYKKKCAIICICLAVCVILLLGTVSTALGIEKGNMREMLSVPMQQIARVWNYNISSITEVEMEVITDIIPIKYLKQYDEYSADPVKAGFDTQEFQEDPMEFLKIWFKLGIRNPKLYLESFFCGGYQYWYVGPREYGYDTFFYDGSYMDKQYDTLKITRHTLLPVYDEYLRNITVRSSYNRLPVISVLLNMAFPFWVIIIGSSILMYLKKYKYISVFILPMGYWGTCLLGPVAMPRYALPLIVGIPLYIGVVLVAKGELN